MNMLDCHLLPVSKLVHTDVPVEPAVYVNELPCPSPLTPCPFCVCPGCGGRESASNRTTSQCKGEVKVLIRYVLLLRARSLRILSVAEGEAIAHSNNPSSTGADASSPNMRSKSQLGCIKQSSMTGFAPCTGNKVLILPLCGLLSC